MLESTVNRMLLTVAAADADARVVLLALDGREERVLLELLVGSRCHLFIVRDDRFHISLLHQ